MNRLSAFITDLKISKKFSFMVIIFFIIFLLVVSISMVLVIRTVLGRNIAGEVKIKSEILRRNLGYMEQRALAHTEWFSTSERLANAFSSGNRGEAIKIGQDG